MGIANADFRDHNQGRAGFDPKDHKIRDYELQMDDLISDLSIARKALHEILHTPSSASHAIARVTLDRIGGATNT